MSKSNHPMNYLLHVITCPNGISVRVSLPERMRLEFLQGLSKRFVGCSTGDLYSELFTKSTMLFFYSSSVVNDLVPYGISPQIWFYNVFLDALYHAMIDVYCGGLAY